VADVIREPVFGGDNKVERDGVIKCKVILCHKCPMILCDKCKVTL
jgi:hypothetical protein